jgi:hypothetical protein
MTSGLRKRIAEIKTVTVEKIGTLKVTYSGWEAFGCILECNDMNGDMMAMRRRAVAQYVTPVPSRLRDTCEGTLRA